MSTILNSLALMLAGVLVVAGGQLLAWIVVGLFIKENKSEKPN